MLEANTNKFQVSSQISQIISIGHLWTLFPKSWLLHFLLLLFSLGGLFFLAGILKLEDSDFETDLKVATVIWLFQSRESTEQLEFGGTLKIT